MKGIQLVILDLAGTTIQDDGNVPAAFTSALQCHGIEATPDVLISVRGASKREVIARLAGQKRADAVYKSFQQTLQELISTKGVQEIAGTTDTLSWLHASGIKIALNTGFDRKITTTILSVVGWNMEWITAVVCGDQVAHGRPAPDLILLAMRSCGVTDPQLVSNVGDTALDLQAGNNAGVRFNIGVLTGAHSRARLEREPHTHILQSVSELPSIIL